MKNPGKEQCRIIVDALRTNFISASPRTVELASSETSARLEVLLPDRDLYKDMAPLTQAICDMKDAFHRFGLRQGLAKYFEVGQGIVGARIDEDRVELAWAALPMWFSLTPVFAASVPVIVLQAHPVPQWVPKRCAGRRGLPRHHSLIWGNESVTRRVRHVQRRESARYRLR